MTVRDLCLAALQRIATVGAGELPPQHDLDLALARLNALVPSWRTRPLLDYASVRTVHALTATDGVYTLGPGGDISLPRPAFPPRLRLVDTSTTPATEFPIAVLTTERAYADLPQKALTSAWPTQVYYNATAPLATLTFYPVLTSTTLAVAVYTPVAGATLALTDVLELPPGYALFYQEALAVHLCPDFERQPSPVLVESAREARQTLAAPNVRVEALVTRTPFDTAWYDITTDQPWGHA